MWCHGVNHKHGTAIHDRHQQSRESQALPAGADVVATEAPSDPLVAGRVRTCRPSRPSVLKISARSHELIDTAVESVI